MATCHPHLQHAHQHGLHCGHGRLHHQDHFDYIHDGHLHHAHADHVDDHAFAVDAAHPDGCTHGHRCGSHMPAHKHSATCGHPAVPHGEHVDHLVAGHFHCPHDGHCDHHGLLAA